MSLVSWPVNAGYKCILFFLFHAAVEVVPAALADIPVTTTVENAETGGTVETVDTIAGMTEAAMIAMTKGITTDHTGKCTSTAMLICDFTLALCK